MAAIRSANTGPEMIVRRLLHREGYRFRLHDRKLPGTPDLTLAKWNAVIEVHGCFFHLHDCHLFSQPSGDSADFWARKLETNAARDRRNANDLTALGKRRLIVWQCSVTGKTRLSHEELISRIGEWLRGSAATGEIRGSD